MLANSNRSSSLSEPMPKTAPVAHQKKSSADASRGKSPQQVLLLVDDDIPFLHAMKRSLRKEPYDIYVSSSALQGLELIRRIKVDVVISDYRMPDMDGLKFLKKVNETVPQAILMMLTGVHDIHIAVDAINVGGIYKYFLKPMNTELIKTEINEAMKLADTSQANPLYSNKITKEYKEVVQLEKMHPDIFKLPPRDKYGYFIMNDTEI